MKTCEKITSVNTRLIPRRITDMLVKWSYLPYGQGTPYVQEIFRRLGNGPFPRTKAHMQEEQRVAGILLSVESQQIGGAVPGIALNFINYFVQTGRVHLAAEFALHKKFQGLRNTDYLFRQLTTNLDERIGQYNPALNPKILALRQSERPVDNKYFSYWKDQNHRLLYTLAQNDFWPADIKIFQDVQQALLQTHPSFFEDKKAECAHRIMQADTPEKLWRVLAEQSRIRY